MAARKSSDSMRTDHDYSLLAVAAMLVVLAFAVSQHVIPNYHELQALERRHKALKKAVHDQQRANATLQDQIDALDDPYYLAEYLVEHYGWRRAPMQLEHAAGG